MRNGLAAILAGAAMAVFATEALAAEPTQVERVQAALDAWLAARAPIEKVTGIAAYFGTHTDKQEQKKLRHQLEIDYRKIHLSPRCRAW